MTGCERKTGNGCVKLAAPKLLVNSLQTPDGTVIESRYRHDYVTYKDANGSEYMVDGGLDYVRRSAVGDEKDLSVYTTDPHAKIRERLRWGTRGVSGTNGVEYVAIKDLDTDHIEAILDTQHHISDVLSKIFFDELSYRKGLH